MTLEAMKQAAFDRIRRRTDADCKPDICDALMDIIDDNMFASVWTANTAYGVGDVVQLYPRNGHRYACITAGTSDATFAAFPTSTDRYSRDEYWVGDGTVVWLQAGADYPNLVNERAVLHECYMLKLARSAGLTDVTIQGRSVSGSQIPARFAELAMMYLPAGCA